MIRMMDSSLAGRFASHQLILLPVTAPGLLGSDNCLSALSEIGRASSTIFLQSVLYKQSTDQDLTAVIEPTTMQPCSCCREEPDFGAQDTEGSFMLTCSVSNPEAFFRFIYYLLYETAKILAHQVGYF